MCVLVRYAHPRANDFFANREQLEDVLRQLAKATKTCDPSSLNAQQISAFG